MILSTLLVPIDLITGWRDISHHLDCPSLEVSIETSPTVMMSIMVALILSRRDKARSCCADDQLSLMVGRLSGSLGQSRMFPS